MGTEVLIVPLLVIVPVTASIFAAPISSVPPAVVVIVPPAVIFPPAVFVPLVLLNVRML